jgi:hypothetical protein
VIFSCSGGSSACLAAPRLSIEAKTEVSLLHCTFLFFNRSFLLLYGSGFQKLAILDAPHKLHLDFGFLVGHAIGGFWRYDERLRAIP